MYLQSLKCEIEGVSRTEDVRKIFFEIHTFKTKISINLFFEGRIDQKLFKQIVKILKERGFRYIEYTKTWLKSIPLPSQ